MDVFEAGYTALTIVTSRVPNSVFYDYDKTNVLTVDCTKASNTKCLVSNINFGTLTSAQVKLGAYISGFVKATYADATVAFSPVTITLLRKLLIHHLKSCFSMRWCLR